MLYYLTEWFLSCPQVSATDPDCGVNAMVNYTIGEDFGKLKEFTVRSATGEICIAGDLDYETRNVFEFAVLATDRGEFISLDSLSCHRLHIHSS